MSPTSLPSPPEPIAAYLRALDDPSSMKDLDAVAEIEQRLARDDLDVAERLELLLRRRTLQQVDIGPLEEAFIEAVPTYLTGLGLDIADVREDFTTVGVRPDVLDRITQGSREATGGPVSASSVRNYILSRNAAFTQKDVMQATGASRGTVGKVIRSLGHEGRLEISGGRPLFYQLAQ